MDEHVEIYDRWSQQGPNGPQYCKGKRIFKTEERAQRCADELNALPEDSPRRLRPYPCRSHFHLTNRPRSSRIRARLSARRTVTRS